MGQSAVQWGLGFFFVCSLEGKSYWSYFYFIVALQVRCEQNFTLKHLCADCRGSCSLWVWPVCTAALLCSRRVPCAAGCWRSSTGRHKKPVMPRGLLYVLATDDYFCLSEGRLSLLLCILWEGCSSWKVLSSVAHGFLRNIPLGMKFRLVGFTPWKCTGVCPGTVGQALKRM